VVSYDVELVRNPALMIDRIGQIFTDQYPNAEAILEQVLQLADNLKPVHEPLDCNYAHCEIRGDEPSRTIKKVLRFLLKHCAEPILKPNEEPTEVKISEWFREMELLKKEKGMII